VGEHLNTARVETEVVDVEIRAPHAVIYFVRHAHAGTRTLNLDDHLRPLSAIGQYQAQVLAEVLEPSVVGDILSSPFVRCVDTLGPLAAGRGCQVLLTDALTEGAEIEPLRRLLEEVPSGSVLCTHGDVLHGFIESLAPSTIDIGEFGCFDKGVVWVLSRDGDCLSVVEVIPPPPASTAAVNGGAGSCLGSAGPRDRIECESR
jgi:8-oxo-dGTP diphosphatase